MSEPIVTFDERAVRGELRELVRRTVEDTLNALLEEEADDLVKADRYERTAEREAYRAGHYERGLATTSGQVALKMPKLKGMRFATAIIERYKRRETSVEEAMIEMYLAGISTRRIEDVSEILWGARVSAATVSNWNEKAFEAVEKWRSRPLACKYPYVFIDGIYLRRSWGGSFENVAVMVAIGVNDDGHREVIGAAEGFTESSECWRDFLSWLKGRGLSGVRMLAGDKAAAMTSAIAEVFPDAAYQRCTVRSTATCSQRHPTTAPAGGGHAQGDTRPGILRRGGQESGKRRRRACRREAERGRQVRAGRRGGNAHLHEVPHGALEAHPHQQRHRAPEPRDKAENASSWHVPRRKERPHARRSTSQIRGRQRVGIEAVSGRHAARRVIMPTASRRLLEFAQESGQ